MVLNAPCSQLLMGWGGWILLQVGTKSSDSGGTGPEPCGILPGKVCGGRTLLLRTVRLLGSKLRGRERGEACSGTAVAIERDTQCIGCGRAFQKWGCQVPQLEGKASTVWVQMHLSCWKCC